MNLLNQRCQHERVTITKNAQKQSVKTWNVIESKVKCNIQYERISTNNYQQKDTGLNTSGTHIGFFEKDKVLLKGDKIIWNGINLFVKGIPFPVFASGNRVHHIEVLLSVEET